MTSKSPGLTLLEAHNFNRWAAKNPDQLLLRVFKDFRGFFMEFRGIFRDFRVFKGF